MKFISIVINLNKKDTAKILKKILQAGVKYKFKFYLRKDDAHNINLSEYGVDDDTFYKKCDVVIVLGGDGTFISAANRFYKNKKPILGIHLGSLGFLTEFKKNEIDILLKYIAENKITVEKRLMIQTDVYRENKLIDSYIGINEAVISKSGFSQIVELKAYVNDNYVGTFRGDGLLVSTPTGSTGYSLAANGPIAVPLTELLVFNTICPHTMSTRPIVLPSSAKIKIEIVKEKKDILLTVDGHRGMYLQVGDKVCVKKSKYKLLVIRAAGRNFFDIMREKFQWIS